MIRRKTVLLNKDSISEKRRHTIKRRKTVTVPTTTSRGTIVITRRTKKEVEVEIPVVKAVRMEEEEGRLVDQ